MAAGAALANIGAGGMDASYLNANSQYMGFKNRIINGAMVIDQRNAGASVAFGTGYAYYVDRWQGKLTSGSGSPTIGQSLTAPAGFTNSLLMTNGTGASPASTATNAIQQSIEGYNIADLGWGTANAKSVTLSFWVRSSLTGTFGGALENTNSRSYPFTYTISSANTWEQKTVTIAGDTSGTWLTTNGLGIQVWFDLGSGSTLQGTAGAWAGADYRAATGCTQFVANTGATFYITGVQLEKGSTATSFDYRPYGTELALCQRYCFRLDAASGQLTTNFGAISAGAGFATISLPVTPRVSPTGIVASSNWLMNNYASGSVPATTPTFVTGTSSSFSVQCSGGGSMTAGTMGQFYPNAASGYIYTTGSEL
jgi:hypothetical protein